MDFQTCSLTVMLKTFCSIKSSWADSLIRWLIYRNVSDTLSLSSGFWYPNSHAGDRVGLWNVGEFEPPGMAVSLQKFDWILLLWKLLRYITFSLLLYLQVLTTAPFICCCSTISHNCVFPEWRRRKLSSLFTFKVTGVVAIK